MECRDPYANNHNYIILCIDYFTKWAKVMPIFSKTVVATTLFFFNCVIARFGVSKKLVFDHG